MTNIEKKILHTFPDELTVLKPNPVNIILKYSQKK